MIQNSLNTLVLLLLVFLCQDSLGNTAKPATFYIDLQMREHDKNKVILTPAHMKRFEDMAIETGTYETGFNWIIKEVLSLGNIQFVGEVFIGYNQSSYDLVFDTGSSFPWIAHRESKFFKNDTSTEGAFTRKGFVCYDSPSCYVDETHLKWYQFMYGKGKTKGVIIEDTLSLGPGFEVKRTPILLALEATGICL